MKGEWQTIKVKGEELVGCVRRLIHEGNVRRVVVKQRGETLAEFPLTVGVVGAVAAPIMAAVGALAALLTDCTLEVQRRDAHRAAVSPVKRSSRASKKKM